MPLTAMLCGCTILVVATEFMVVGLAPYLSDALALSPTDYSLVLSSFAIASAIAGPLLIIWSKRFPPNVVLAGSMVPFGANIALYLWPSFEFVLVLRALQGGALPVLVSIANVILCDRMGMGRGTSCLYVGVVLGGTLAPPASAALAAEFGWQSPFVILGILALIGTGLLLKAPMPAMPSHSMDWRRIGRSHRLWLHLAVTCSLFMALFASFAHISLFLETAASSKVSVSLLLFTFGMGGLVGNWLGGLFETRPLYANAIVLGVATLCGAALAWAENPTTAALFGATLVWGGAHAAAFVVAQIRLFQALPTFKALAGSLNISAGNIGIAVGAYLGGKAITLGGGAEAANVVTACLAAVSISTALFLARRSGSCPKSGIPSKV